MPPLVAAAREGDAAPCRGGCSRPRRAPVVRVDAWRPSGRRVRSPPAVWRQSEPMSSTVRRPSLPERHGQAAAAASRVALAPCSRVRRGQLAHDVEGHGQADLDRRDAGRADRGGSRTAVTSRSASEPERGRGRRPTAEVLARTARSERTSSRLHHDQAAVDGEDLAGDERRLVGDEEGDRGGDLLGRAEAAQRRARA